MSLKFYNSLTKKLEEFKPVHEGHVTMYNCGPTVYSYAHIGNFRSYIFADIIRRYLEFKGYEVTQVVNITDVGHLTDDGDDGEDKLEEAAKKEKKHPLEIAEFYTKQFLEDWQTLNMEEPEFRPKATETIPEIIELTKVLLENGHAYESNGNIYFDISSFPEYGHLSGNKLDKLTQSRVEADSNKKNKHDFVLWFSESKYKNHILKWDSPWGEGYPGWHMECSCMSAKFLTKAFDKDGHFHADKFETIDIHTGGEDNKFPHHECEIAQTQGATDKPYVHYWMHAKHLLCEGEKMSKSLGNVYQVFDLVKEGFSPRAIRYLLISGHYRLPLNFTKEGITAAQKSLERIDNMLIDLYHVDEEKEASEPVALLINELKLVIEKEMDNDLNVSGAFGAIFEAVRELNKHKHLIGSTQAQSIIQTFFDIDKIFGILDKLILDQELIPQDVMDLVQTREIARAQKDWAASDELREKIKQEGYEVKDTSDGPIVKKA